MIMTPLEIDDQNELREIEPPLRFPAPVKWLAKILSWVFHPLFIPVYVSWFLVKVQPYLFASFDPFEQIIVMIRFFVMYAMFPLVSVLLAKGLGFIDSIYLRTQKERIIPYIASGVYYFWMWYVLRNQPEFPDHVVSFSFAIFLASSFGLLANIYMKVSMHALSLGVMCTYMAWLAFILQTQFGFYVTMAFLIAGLVLTARFIVSDHTQKEIYTGFFLGVLAQVIGFVL